MKQKIIIFWAIIIGVLFFVFHYKQIGNYYYNFVWNSVYEQDDFTWALENYTIAENFSSTPQTSLNIWNAKYKLWDYDDAISDFEKTLEQNDDKKNDTQFKSYHNLWNAFFQKGEQEQVTDTKIQLYTQSIESYDQALDIKDDQQTQENKKIVEQKLDALKKNLENQEKNTAQNQNNEWENESSQWATWDQDQKQNAQSQNSNQSTDNENYNVSGDQEPEKLSQEDKQYLENYLEFLQRIQQENQWDFNSKNEPPKDIFDIFWVDPFFSDDIRGSEKNW